MCVSVRVLIYACVFERVFVRVVHIRTCVWGIFRIGMRVSGYR